MRVSPSNPKWSASSSHHWSSRWRGTNTKTRAGSPASSRCCRDQASQLNRLAQADLVGQQVALDRVSENSPYDRQLMRVVLDRRPRDTCDAGESRSLPRKMAEEAVPGRYEKRGLRNTSSEQFRRILKRVGPTGLVPARPESSRTRCSGNARSSDPPWPSVPPQPPRHPHVPGATRRGGVIPEDDRLGW